ncbi:SDR family NAD(P)-dependent oxidoreductase [Candidatus Calescamantes bacterium]|nr:SDR family NAD(P)-dependent oxidoreductase [Candidatus Calescamantes bacterium]MCK5599282.1 SDR family NAD(P)-dependent oxidoreductase [bacterium]
MNVLVTGGAGFIGSHLVDRLIELGKNVIIIDNLSSGLKANLNSSAIFYKMDIRSLNLKKVFQNHEIDSVFHFAAQIDIRKSLSEIEYEIDVNVKGSVNLIVNAAKYGVAETYFASSGGAIYGEQIEYPATEDHPTEPESPYGIDKLTIEKYLFCFKKLYGFNTSIFRFSNVYGPRQNPQSEAGVVSIFANRMLKDKKINIYGDGNQTRDFVYIRDVVDAMVEVYEQKTQGIFNISTGKEATVNEIFHILADELKYGREPIYLEARPGELLRSLLSHDKLKSATGWEPTRDMRTGLRETGEWFKENFK